MPQDPNSRNKVKKPGFLSRLFNTKKSEPLPTVDEFHKNEDNGKKSSTKEKQTEAAKHLVEAREGLNNNPKNKKTVYEPGESPPKPPANRKLRKAKPKAKGREPSSNDLKRLAAYNNIHNRKPSRS